MVLRSQTNERWKIIMLKTTLEMCKELLDNNNLSAVDIHDGNMYPVKRTFEGEITNSNDNFTLTFDDTKRWLVYKQWQSITFDEALERLESGKDEIVRVANKVHAMTTCPHYNVFMGKGNVFTLSQIKTGTWYRPVY